MLENKSRGASADESTKVTNANMTTSIIPSSYPSTPSTGYGPAEDVAVMGVYVAISLNPIVGSEQKDGTRYQPFYHAHLNRNPDDTVTRPFKLVEMKCLVTHT